MQALHDGASNKLDTFGSKNRVVWVEGDRSAGLATARSWPYFLQFALELASIDEFHVVALAITVDFEKDLLRQGVDHADAHAVETTRDFVALAAKLATGMEHGENNFGCALALVGARWVWINGDASTIVVDTATAIFQKGDSDTIAEPGHCFVDSVVYDLPDEVMQASKACGPDIHTGAFTNWV